MIEFSPLQKKIKKRSYAVVSLISSGAVQTVCLVDLVYYKCYRCRSVKRCQTASAESRNLEVALYPGYDSYDLIFRYQKKVISITTASMRVLAIAAVASNVASALVSAVAAPLCTRVLSD